VVDGAGRQVVANEAHRARSSRSGDRWRTDGRTWNRTAPRNSTTRRSRGRSTKTGPSTRTLSDVTSGRRRPPTDAAGPGVPESAGCRSGCR
jgi:hypothetical protein